MDYTLSDRIAVITLDDGKANVVNPAFIESLNACLDRAEAEQAGAVLLAGREGMFSAGFDLKVFQESIEAGITMVMDGVKLAIRLYALPMPLVAACTGHGIAMGAFLLLACDTRVGARGEFKLTLPETRISMDIPLPLLELTRSRVPANYLARVAIQAEIFTPDNAIAAGFLDEVVEPDMVVEHALVRAGELAALPQQNYATNKLNSRRDVLAAMQTELAQS